MTGFLDTNVLVRYVVEDDSGQLAAARRLIKRCVSDGQSLFVPVTVTLELEWVLRASFGYSKDDVLHGGRSRPSSDPDYIVRNMLGDGFCGLLTGQDDVKRP